MMRAAVVKMVRAGLYLCATAHDAIMIQAPLESLKTDVALAQSIMERISLSFTQGLLVRTEAKVLRPGERMIEKRGERMWSLVIDLLANVETYEMHQRHQTHPMRPIRGIRPMGPMSKQ
jgi:hypothetical protein